MDLKISIPRTCCKALTIGRNAEARNTVLMTGERTDDLSLEGIPGANFELVVAAEEVLAGDGEVDGGDSGLAGFILELLDLLTRADVPEVDAGVVGACGEGGAAGEEGTGVDVSLVAAEGHDVLAGTNIPKLGTVVARTGDEGVLFGAERQADDVGGVAGECGGDRRGVDVPFHAGVVTRARDDGGVGFEANARQEAAVLIEFHVGVALRIEITQVEDGAAVVEAARGDEGAARGVRAGHDPPGPQADRSNLVRRVSMPDNELTVLGGAHKMVAVLAPVQGVDLRHVAAQSSSSLNFTLGVGGQRTRSLQQIGVSLCLLLGQEFSLHLLRDALGLSKFAIS